METRSKEHSTVGGRSSPTPLYTYVYFTHGDFRLRIHRQNASCSTRGGATFGRKSTKEVSSLLPPSTSDHTFVGDRLPAAR